MCKAKIPTVKAVVGDHTLELHIIVPRAVAKHFMRCDEYSENIMLHSSNIKMAKEDLRRPVDEQKHQHPGRLICRKATAIGQKSSPFVRMLDSYTRLGKAFAKMSQPSRRERISDISRYKKQSTKICKRQTNSSSGKLRWISKAVSVF